MLWIRCQQRAKALCKQPIKEVPFALILIGSSREVSNDNRAAPLLPWVRCQQRAREGTMQTCADKESASRMRVEVPTRCHLTLTLLREVSNDNRADPLMSIRCQQRANRTMKFRNWQVEYTVGRTSNKQGQRRPRRPRQTAGRGPSLRCLFGQPLWLFLGRRAN